MSVTYQRATELIVKYYKGELTPAEQQELDGLSHGSPAKEAWYKDLMDPYKMAGTMAFVENVDIAYHRDRLAQMAAQKQAARSRRRRLLQYAAAAAAAGLVAISAWYLLRPPNTASLALLPDEESFLQLPDGRKLRLSLLVDGPLDAGNLQIIKKGHQLTYTTNPTGQEQSLHHRLYVERGKNYVVILPDSSRISVSESTVLNYPVRFNGQERTVAITGEAYFDVKKLAGNPFKAQVVANALDTNSQSLNEAVAFGTKFNVRAYAREQQEEITLYEGALKVYSKNDSIPLQAGQQIILKPNKKPTITNTSKQVQVTTSRQGLFRFKDTNVKTIMQEIERWYDIKVVFSGPVQQKKITFLSDCSQPLERILEMIRANNITITTKGKEVHVSVPPPMPG